MWRSMSNFYSKRARDWIRARHDRTCNLSCSLLPGPDQSRHAHASGLTSALLTLRNRPQSAYGMDGTGLPSGAIETRAGEQDD
jgi:hypothetical protein